MTPHQDTHLPSAAAVEVACATLQPFIGPHQLAVLRAALRGEERAYFSAKLVDLAALIAAMPQTGEQDGLGEAAVVSLHYFAGGSANWWITEKDAGDGTEDTGQHQAFGLANLFGGPTDQDAELGYISIAEILAHGGELDLHFTPTTLGQLQGPAAPL